MHIALCLLIRLLRARNANSVTLRLVQSCKAAAIWCASTLRVCLQADSSQLKHGSTLSPACQGINRRYSAFLSPESSCSS